MGRLGLVSILLAAWMVGAWAQPPVDDVYLSVQVVRHDGTPFPVRPITSIRPVSALGGHLTSTPNAPIIQDNAVVWLGLTAEPYQLSMSLPAFSLSEQCTLTLRPGMNLYIWKLPPLGRLHGDLLVGGQPISTPIRCQAFLQMTGTPGSRPVTLTFAEGQYALGDLAAGSYNLLVLTEQGCALLPFTAPPATAEIAQPLTLVPGGTVTFTVTAPRPAPLSDARVVLQQKVGGVFPLYMALPVGEDGTITTLALPEGEWQWTVYMPGMAKTAGTVTVTAGTAQAITARMISFLPASKPNKL